MTDEIFYTVQEIADILKVKRRYIYEMLKSKKIKGLKLSTGKKSSWRIPASEINALCCKAYDED